MLDLIFGIPKENFFNSEPLYFALKIKANHKFGDARFQTYSVGRY